MFIKKESAAISAPHIVKAVHLEHSEHMYQLHAFNVPFFIVHAPALYVSKAYLVDLKLKNRRPYLQSVELTPL